VLRRRGEMRAGAAAERQPAGQAGRGGARDGEANRRHSLRIRFLLPPCILQ